MIGCAPCVLRRNILPASGVAEKVTGGIPSVHRETGRQRRLSPSAISALGHLRRLGRRSITSSLPRRASFATSKGMSQMGAICRLMHCNVVDGNPLMR
jgi:hypothetical protein